MKRNASMRLGALLPVLVALACLALAPALHAQDCGKPPEGYGKEWGKAFAKWCSCVGGRLSDNAQECLDVPKGKRGSTKADRAAVFAQQSADAAGAAAATAAEVEAEGEGAEAERKRQEEARRSADDERQRKEAEERKRSQAVFNRNKDKALREMNAIAGELGLKGTDDSFGLKMSDPVGGLGLTAASDAPPPAPRGCTWGDQGPATVDLRCLGLDPDKPIVVDPHVARGEERVFPAQIDPATFQNRHYNDGFAALMRPTFSAADAADAVASFQAARTERPNDPLVRNAFLLAQDILRGRQQRDREQQSSAAFFRLQAYAALMAGDAAGARSHIAQARKLEPGDTTAVFLESLAATAGPGTLPARRDAYRLVGNGLAAIRQQSHAAAVQMLQEARRLQPDDKFIAAFLGELQKYEAGSARE